MTPTPETTSASARPTDLPTDLPADLPAGLDAARIDAAIADAESTRVVHASAWGQWQRWCTERGLTPLPTDPVAMCAYLTQRAESGITVATLNVACSAIGYHHRLAGVENPVALPSVRRVRLGLRRRCGTAPRRRARALSVAELTQILTSIETTTAIGVRDRAIILLGYASALRCGELTALTLADLEHQPSGLLLTVRHSKTDPEGHGHTVGVAHGQHPHRPRRRTRRLARPPRTRTRTPVQLGPVPPHQPRATHRQHPDPDDARPRPRRRPARRRHHRPLPARRARHHRRPSRRPTRPDRRPDPTPRPRPVRAWSPVEGG